MAINAKAFSTNFEDHEGLLHKFTRRNIGVVMALNLPMDYEDLYGEMSVAFTKAVKGWDPERGISFTAYLGQCCQNHFYSKVLAVHGHREITLDSEGKERSKFVPRCVPTSSLEELSESTGMEMSSIYELVQDEAAPSPEDTLIAKEAFLRNLSKLSAPARRYLMVLVGTAKSPKDGYTREESRQIRAELASVYGVTLNALR